MILVIIDAEVNANPHRAGGGAMAVNRLLGLFRDPSAISRDEPAAAAVAPPAFAPYPLAFNPNIWQQQIYQTAWERARKELAPCRTQRLDKTVWN
jgi:hypothetical protein